MYSKDWFAGKKITIMGLGVYGGGLGVARWLLRAGARLTVTDLKPRRELVKSVLALEKEYNKATKKNGGRRIFRPKLVLGRHDERDFLQAEMIIRNPAVRRDNPFLVSAMAAGVPVETEAALFLLLCPFPVTAITGTKGKSTVTTLLGNMAQRYDSRTVIGGNIKISPFDSLDRLLLAAKKNQRPVPVILELSSWQIEGLEKHHLSPHIAAVTNILPDHLNTYSGLDDYVRTKSLVYAYQNAADTAVINLDDPRVRTMDQNHFVDSLFGGRKFYFSRRPFKGDGCFIKDGQIMIRDRGEVQPLMPLSAIRLSGEHNVSNILAACALAYVMSIPKKIIVAAVRNFRGVESRQEEVMVIDGVRYINDTTATMPEASIVAMKSFTAGDRRKKIILLAGGATKSLRYDDWAAAAKKYTKAVVLLAGTETPTLESELKQVGYSGEVWLVDSMHHAVQTAVSLAIKGEIVLLSPACSSFGMFKNEFDRGEQFVREVKKLTRK